MGFRFPESKNVGIEKCENGERSESKKKKEKADVSGGGTSASFNKTR